MYLRNLKIAPRAGLGFAILALLVRILGGLSLSRMQRMQGKFDELSDYWLPSIQALNEMSQDLLRIRAITLRVLVNRDQQSLAQNEQHRLALKQELKGSQGATNS